MNIETYRYVEEEVLNADYNVVVRHSYLPDRAYNPESFLSVLANYPWQEYGYKVGRWQRENFFDGTFLEILGLKYLTWEKKHDTVLLTDLRNGQPVSEVIGMVLSGVEPLRTATELPGPAGTVAGRPPGHPAQTPETQVTAAATRKTGWRRTWNSGSRESARSSPAGAVASDSRSRTVSPRRAPTSL
ncbi:hypothetical protein [Amycolatopsis pigmentata]|uniref:Uncharacterized protein n=1 Tax=Amycolatopsis pigmentata TaxID=450801 RepID=A0ABW5G4A9_9PSEU